jgi:cyclopropane-fatty-acyl-phospholipid synthase
MPDLLAGVTALDEENTDVYSSSKACPARGNEVSGWEISLVNAEPTMRSESGMDRRYREILLWALNRLTCGELIIEDGENEWRVGTADRAGIVARVRILDRRFYGLAVLRHSLGVAEAYRLGYWEAENLTDVIRIFVRRRGLESGPEKFVSRLAVIPASIGRLIRPNNRANSRDHIEAHYDLGNEFFQLFLDSTMAYSCGVFESEASSLEEASVAKFRRIGDKLGLQSGHSVVEIGSGWGGFAIFAARTYGCRVTTVTISPAQFEEAKSRVCEVGLAHLVDVQLRDYRDLDGQYDRLVSIEMIEAIGHARLREYFAKCSRLLKPDGLMAIQAITMPDRGYRGYLTKTDFIQKYIFPGSCCPARTAIFDAATRASDLRVVDLEEIGWHYARTLAEWRSRFVASIPQVLAMGYPAEFVRIWHYYLCYCEGGFEERYVGDVQLVFSKPDYRGEN